MAVASNEHLGLQILQGLKSNKNLVPTQEWLAGFLSSQRAGLPVNALVSTASFRLLAADMKGVLNASQTAALPSDVVDVEVKERKITGPVLVQVLDVEDMGRSRWSQVEELEADERGEKTKGREIIRVTPTATGEVGEGDQPAAAAVTKTGSSGNSGSGPHKLLVEDVRGTKVYAIETTRLEGVGLGMNIGGKMVLRDVTVARGVLLLDTPNVTLLGGKIEHLQQHWKATRKARLKASIQKQQ